MHDCPSAAASPVWRSRSSPSFPIIDRLGPPAYFACVDLFILALAAWNFRARGRLHPATLWGGLVLIASQPLRLVVSG